MKKIFTYIEHLWIGDDGQPSGKRASALALTIHMMWSISDNLNSYTHLLKAVYGHDKNITPEVVTSAGASLGSLALVLGVEATVILALWGIASYQSVQIGNTNGNGKKYVPTPPIQRDDDYAGVQKIIG